MRRISELSASAAPGSSRRAVEVIAGRLETGSRLGADVRVALVGVEAGPSGVVAPVNVLELAPEFRSMLGVELLDPGDATE